MAQSQAQTTVDTTVANGPNPTTQSPTTQSEGIGSPLPPTGDFMHMLSDENRQIIHRLCTEPVPHMDHPDLHRAKADVELFGVAAKLSPSDGFRFEPPKEITAGRISPATRAPTLTGNQEKQLFLRLNLTRMKICNILNRYTDRPLTPKAARTLIAWGDWELKVREQVVELNMPLVLAMAKRTRLSNIDFNEMISEGNMAAPPQRRQVRLRTWVQVQHLRMPCDSQEFLAGCHEGQPLSWHVPGRIRSVHREERPR
ncbi:MAG: hypothetical protein R3E58_17420 [Phycisphaerae bacterium]